MVSAEGFADAIEKAAPDFDLIIVGHSIPQRDKRAVAELRRRRCTAPVLSLLRANERPIREAADATDPDPLHVLDAVTRLLGGTAARRA